MKKFIVVVKLIFPLIAVFLSIAAYYGFDDSGKQKATEQPYYVYFILIVSGIYLIFAVASVFLKTLKAKILHRVPLLTGTIIFIGLVNLITTKTTILPTLYFPSLDRIIGLIYEQRQFLLENIFSSFKLLITGFIWGAAIGFLTGLALGYNKKVGYWLNPVTKFIGPIPTTTWIPLAEHFSDNEYCKCIFNCFCSVVSSYADDQQRYTKYKSGSLRSIKYIRCVYSL